jgi:hypothetical protein
MRTSWFAEFCRKALPSSGSDRKHPARGIAAPHRSRLHCDRRRDTPSRFGVGSSCLPLPKQAVKSGGIASRGTRRLAYVSRDANSRSRGSFFSRHRVLALLTLPMCGRPCGGVTIRGWHKTRETPQRRMLSLSNVEQTTQVYLRLPAQTHRDTDQSICETLDWDDPPNAWPRRKGQALLTRNND